MPDLLTHLQHDLKNWASNAQNQGWLTERAVRSIDSTTTATPGALFDKPNRPMVVGFFGGTGVGKSTLMNRFAGEAVAKASAERPTSREITIYVHDSVSVAQLPDEFPMQRMRTKTHANNQYRSVMWIDMPDFDSVEQSNRELVAHWLPHIDVVIYVVSPDRYKDDNGWRLLLEHGTQHAWLFVINHWDRGDDRQRDDFLNMLQSAGLQNPHLFCTDCSDSQNKPRDEFETFRDTINALADQQIIEQLESRGVVQRVKQIRSVSDNLRTQFGTADLTESLNPLWLSHWQQTTGELIDSVEWKVPALASLYADQEKGLLGHLYTRIRGRQTDTDVKSDTRGGIDNLIDDTFFDRINESVDDFAQQATQHGVPIRAIQAPLDAIKPHLRDRAHSTMEMAIEQSIAVPGTAMQRRLHRALGWLCWLLPLAAVGWVGFRIVNVFRLGANDPAAYLSSNFAIHSGLLMGLAWLVPTILFIKLKPSREKAAARGIRAGIVHLCEQVDQQVQGAVQQLNDHRRKHIAELDNIMAVGVRVDDDAQLPAALQRMLIQEVPDLPVAGVRATTHS